MPQGRHASKWIAPWPVGGLPMPGPNHGASFDTDTCLMLPILWTTNNDITSKRQKYVVRRWPQDSASVITSIKYKLYLHIPPTLA